ncbi:hypothetical protein N9P38_00245 [Flavobacteriales bacterium]|nr:hypothetical protein [Flavobacteriales bacterium]MDB4088828.1 hypothetical protein [Flavobacteriales bacterium]
MSEDLLDDFQNETKELPQMLNVLTILTFIGSGLALLMNIWSFITHDSKVEEFEQSMAQLESLGGTGNSLMDGMMEGAVKAIENGPTLYTIAIVVAILCLFGAYQMRSLKKTGYYIYVAGCLIGIVGPLAIIGGGIMGGMILLGSVFSILFIILYGVNLKHMS